ncbi:hypothetical protein L9F63_002867 [Diploptera punctata]|uniref:Uncharacterized protein n=1 Tax=Diploptera punctata TaxID=6984 RepID=A0AAD7ZRT8_DIPPU|nr:hypothetical protein L9F63_002867 [Diploptera punctata]
MIVGTATRYLAGRGAVQTVYWVGDQTGHKMVKYSRVLTFANKQEASENVSSNNMFSYRHRPLPSSTYNVSTSSIVLFLFK